MTYYTEDVFYEDVPNVENGWAVPMRGHQMIRESLVETFDEMSDLRFELVSASGAGDHIAAEWIMTATHYRDLTGKFSIRAVSIIKLKRDKIAWVRDYYDAHRLLSQLGLVPTLDAEEPRTNRDSATPKDQNPADRSIAFVHVNLIPMDRERVLVDQTVVIRGGRIQEIGPTAKLELPDRAVVIEGHGKYLMPGLADMHVHPDHPDQLLLFIANGVTTIRNMHGAPKYLDWRKRIAEESLLAPFVYTTGPLFDGKPGRGIPGGVLVSTPEEAHIAVIAQKRAGYDYIKVLGGLSLEVYDAVMAEAAIQGLRVVGHVPPPLVRHG